jgi:phenylacetate-coenzyme A ligase PaaK-like adenylate-forming protein
MRLRDELTIEHGVDRFGDPILVIGDPVVRRFFALPAEAEPVLDQLHTTTELAALVAGFADVFDQADLDVLLRGLAANHLLDEGLSRSALRARLRASHRAEHWAAMQGVLRIAERAPIYRRTFGALGFAPGVGTPAELLRAPVLTKLDIREHYPTGFVPDGVDLDEMIETRQLRLATSSGTSAGDRLQMIFSAEARGLQMAAGTSLNEELHRAAKLPQAVLTSMHCADPDVCVRYLPEMQSRIRDGNRLVLMPPDDPGAPTLAEVRAILDELRGFDVRWLDCNPTYLVNVTFAAIDAGLELPRIAVITCSYEFLSVLHRAVLSRAWGCEVYNRFAASEVGNFQAIECHRHSLHLNDRYFYSEIVRDGCHVVPGQVGRLVQTTLQEIVPLIRYDTGDLFVADEDRDCDCGNIGRVVAAIAGRASDLVAATDGSPRTTRQLDVALGGVEGLRSYQVMQTAPTAYRVKVVAEPGYQATSVRSAAADAVRAVLGSDANVRTEGARHIYPEPSGKFRLTGSELPHLDRLISVAR